MTHSTFPYVFLDATYCKVRIGARVVSHALVVATGVSIEGTREVLGRRSVTVSHSISGVSSWPGCGRGVSRGCIW